MTRVNSPTIHEQWRFEKLEWYIKDAFRILFKAYEVIRNKKESQPYSKPSGNMKWGLENQLTDDLVACAEEISEGKRDYAFDRESRNPITRDRIDITLLYALKLGFEYRLAIECKRLDTDLCGKYHSEGICRFITGKYSKKMPVAGMIGYIQGSDALKLVKKINGLLKPRNTVQPLKESHLLDHNQTVYLSLHRREGDLGNINLHHLMLDYRDIIAGCDKTFGKFQPDS